MELISAIYPNPNNFTGIRNHDEFHTCLGKDLGCEPEALRPSIVVGFRSYNPLDAGLHDR